MNEFRSPGNMVYTPKEHIPLLKALKNNHGEVLVHVKHPHKNIYETIPLTVFQAMVIMAAESAELPEEDV